MRALSVSLVGWWACACAPQLDVALDHPGVVATLLVRTDARTGEVLGARAHDPRAGGAALTLEADVVVDVLCYPQPLEAYGLAIASDGALSVVEDGVGLPAPAHWTHVDGEGVASARDVARTSPAAAFPRLRVPARPCPRLVEAVAQRLPLERRRAVSFVGALDAERTVVALHRNDAVGGPPGLAVRGPTGDQAVALPLASAPVGFGEPDGTLWVAAQVGTSTAMGGHLCRFRAGEVLDARACAPDPTQPVALALAGWRGADGVLELVAIDVALALHHRVGDQPWRRLYLGGRPEAEDCQVTVGSMTLRMDGPGTGVAGFESGALERFRIAGRQVERTTLFADAGRTSRCLGAYGQTASGVEVLAEVPALTGGVAPSALVWWRSGAVAPWRPLPHTVPALALSVTALGDALLVSTEAHTVTVFDADPQRPDLPPRQCATVGVYNSGKEVAPTRDGGVIVGGAHALDSSPPAIGRWYLER